MPVTAHGQQSCPSTVGMVPGRTKLPGGWRPHLYLPWPSGCFLLTFLFKPVWWARCQKTQVNVIDPKNLSLNVPEDHIGPSHSFAVPEGTSFGTSPRAIGLPSGMLVQEDLHRHSAYPLSSGVQQRKLFSRLLFPDLENPSHAATMTADVMCWSCTFNAHLSFNAQTPLEVQIITKPVIKIWGLQRTQTLPLRGDKAGAQILLTKEAKPQRSPYIFGIGQHQVPFQTFLFLGSV